METRQYSVQPENDQPHAALDEAVMHSRSKDLFRVFFDEIVSKMPVDSETLETQVRQYWCTVLGQLDHHKHNWIAFVAAGHTSAVINTYNYTNQSVYNALYYWLLCRLILEEKVSPLHTQIDLSLRNRLFEPLFNSATQYILSHERTPCDIRLVNPGTNCAHIREARRLWEVILRQETFRSQRYVTRCQRASSWYTFVNYCATRTEIVRQQQRATFQLARLRARFPGGYHEFDPDSKHYLVKHKSPATREQVLHAYERTRAYEYLIACCNVISNVRLTQGRSVSRARRPCPKRRIPSAKRNKK